jgi:hypothetical protein
MKLAALMTPINRIAPARCHPSSSLWRRGTLIVNGTSRTISISGNNQTGPAVNLWGSVEWSSTAASSTSDEGQRAS